MKFWKPALLTATLLTAIFGTVVLTSCEKNSCDGITCYNGGSCGHGLCNCPTGFEGTECETKTITRYLGTYGGFTNCDNGASTIDTVVVTASDRAIDAVDVYFKSIYPKVLKGYVSSNESTYSIVVTNNDSAKADAIDYLRVFTITLQSDRTLVLHKYEHEYTKALNTFDYKCQFLGTKN